MQGILLKVIAGFCYVEAGNTVYECKPRGNMRRNSGNILAGDAVEFDVLADNKGVIKNTLNRKNYLIRPPIANVDRIFIVSSHNTPSPNALNIDRLISIAENKGIEPIIVFNKSDLGDLSEWVSIYENAGFKTFCVSAFDDNSLCDLKDFIYSSTGISVFSGNSGVGKSSLLNKILPDLDLQTGEVSQKLGRGRHTTRKVELYKLAKDSYIADTPGFSSLDLERCEVVLKEDLANSFREFNDYLTNCKFSTCMHIGEKGCAVCDAVKSGEISQSRYGSYLTLYNEIKDIKEWNIQKNR